MKTLIDAFQNESYSDDANRFRLVEFQAGAFLHPCPMVLIDSRGNIVAYSKDWASPTEEPHAVLINVGPGLNYFEMCRRASAEPRFSRKALLGIHAVLKEKTSSFSMDYASRTPSGPTHFRMTVIPFSYANARVAIIHTDITDLQLAKEKDSKQLQQFAQRLIKAQEEERQRISRELHDDLGNRIALMSLSLRRILKERPEDFRSSSSELDKILQGITDLSTSLRNLSHCLHPPHLHYAGINAALRSLRDGFEKTQGIPMDLVLPTARLGLPAEVELCIFRISQECLQNIAKHSGAQKVRLVLSHTAKHVRLTVSDTGRGFVLSAANRSGGLGIHSMEERALGIGGRLTINTSPGSGTQIRLTIPVRADRPALRAG
jgi:signal transduction histidine kinase